jgi:hypothetical protein
MTNEILPFYNNQMSNWNSFLPKKNKRKIPKSLGILKKDQNGRDY